jgi:hypothetical protein
MYLLGIVCLSFACWPCDGSELLFELRAQDPLERGRKFLYLELLSEGPNKDEQEWLRQYEGGQTNLSAELRLRVCKTLLWKLSFPQAEAIAEDLYKEDPSEAAYRITLAIAKICRGDYEAAKRVLRIPSTIESSYGKALLLYLETVITEDTRSAGPMVREVVASGEFNKLPTAQAAVLAFCLKSPDQELFEQIVAKIDRENLVRDPVATRMYLMLCDRFELHDEAERIERALERVRRGVGFKAG